MGSTESGSEALKAPSPLNLNSFDSAPTYNKGDVFKWKLTDGYDSSVFPTSELELRIDHLFTPFTCSPVMRVSFETNDGPRTAILKTYDRREGILSRQCPGPSDYSEYDCSQDQKLIKLVHEGKAEQLLRDFHDNEYGGVIRRPLIAPTTIYRELYFQSEKLEEFYNESKAYEKMHSLQGHCIPWYIAGMSWRPTCENAEYLAICAILIEDVVNASTLEDFFRFQTWNNLYFRNSGLFAKILDEKERFLDLMRGTGVYDMDRHDGNSLIVIHNLEREEFKLIHIDFGFSQIIPAKNESHPREQTENTSSELHAKGVPTKGLVETSPGPKGSRRDFRSFFRRLHGFWREFLKRCDLNKALVLKAAKRDWSWRGVRRKCVQ